MRYLGVTMDEDRTGELPPYREDPRPAQTRDFVLQAARMIITSQGQAAVTPTRLVELSGVARSTIYRHWPDAAAIIVDAMAADVRRESNLDSTGDPGADLRSYLTQLREVLESPGATLIVAQAEIAERDSTAAQQLAAVGIGRSKVIHELLDDETDDFSTTHAQLVGPLFMQRFFMRDAITDDLIDTIVEAYLQTRA